MTRGTLPTSQASPELVGYWAGDPVNYADTYRNGYTMRTPDLNPEWEEPDIDESDMPVSPNTPEASPEKATTRENKLLTIYEEYGFYPATAKELSVVWGLRKYRDTAGGAALYLNRVLQHQMKPDVEAEEPAAAVRALAGSWIQWKEEATGDKTMLGLFEAGRLNEDLSDSATQRAQQLVQRTFALDRIAQSDAQYPARPYSRLDKQESVATLKPDELQAVVWQAYMSAEARRVFWRSVLHQAYIHDVARPLVRGTIIEPPARSK
jgi:hypothetical protein